MAKTDWNLNDTVQPADMNTIGQEINGNSAAAQAAQTAINDHINAVSDAHAASAISTTDGTNVQAEIDGLKSSVSSGKSEIASAITDMNQSATGSDAYAQLAAAIRNISDDATAMTGDVLVGETFYQGGAKRTGTMPDRGNVTQTLISQGQTYTIPQGHHGGSGTVTANITNLSAANIKDGATVGGVTGTFSETTSPAAATQILSGRVAFANGSQVTGSMPNRGAVNQTITTQNGQYTIPSGYHNGTGKVTASFANLIPSNVRDGVNIGGVVGTLIEGKLHASGSATSGNNLAFTDVNGSIVYRASFTVSGLNFPNGIGVVLIRDTDPANGAWTLFSHNTLVSGTAGPGKINVNPGGIMLILNNPASVTNTGFTLAVHNTNRSYYWDAWGL